MGLKILGLNAKSTESVQFFKSISMSNSFTLKVQRSVGSVALYMLSFINGHILQAAVSLLRHITKQDSDAEMHS